MEIIKEVSNFYELKENSWSGALDTLKDIENTDKEDELMSLLEDVFSGKTPTESEVNDFLWFERDFIYENVGLTSDGELPTVVDEARADNTVYALTVAELKRAGIFDESLINYVIDMIQTDEDEEGNPIYDEEEIYRADFEEIENNSDNEITEEQVEWLNANG